MTFHNIRPPRFIELFANGCPEFATSCATMASGREVRMPTRDLARQKYLIENCKLSHKQFGEFNAFFRARAGQAHSFLFRDLADFKYTGFVPFSSIVDRNQFGLLKIYNDMASPHIRHITKPVPNSIKISIAEQKIAPKSIDYYTGIVTLPQIINRDDDLLIEFMFNVEVRFAQDSFKYSHHPNGTIELDTIELVEVLA
jgi:uncharacterized protein (TIGR02217 family)